MLLLRGSQPEPVDVRVRAGRVVETGPRLDPERDEPVVDLGGRFVRRGLRDAHVHMAQWARARRQLDVSTARGPSEAADLVARAVAARPAGGRLEGSGFRDSTWSEPPTADLLSAVAPDLPVVLHSLDRHSAWLNRPALALVGLPDHPTGLLREHEAWEALLRLPPPTPAEDDDAAGEAVAAAHARGVTRIVDFDFEDAWAAWRRRQSAGDGTLGLRVTAVVLPAQLDGHRAAGRREGSGDDWLRLGPVKLFADGSLGSRTARCLHPYPGTGDRGRRLLDPPALRAAVLAARDAGFRVAVHAIGDEATRDALAVLDEVLVPGASLEHAQLLRREDLPRFRSSGVTASVQPAHLLDDRGLVDELWAGTPSVPFALRSLLDAGARLAFGSDAPVSPLDPWRGIAAAVHRTDGNGEPWRPEEAVSAEEALEASGGRRVRPGDAADLVVLDVPRLPETPGGLLAVPVHAVLLGGRWVHGPHDDEAGEAPART